MHKSKAEHFIKKNECSDINGWLKWWDERGNYIFRAFKGFKDPRCNKAGVIDASWLHRGHMTVSFLDACILDIRDTLILEGQLKQFEGRSYSGGPSLNHTQRTKRVKNKEKEDVHRFGRDLLNFGIKGSVSVQHCAT